MLVQHVPLRAYHQAPVPSLPPPLLSGECRLGGGTSIRLQAQSRNPRDPRRLMRSGGLRRLPAESIRYSSLARLRLFGLRDTFPSNKADKPRNLSRTTSPNGSCLRWSAAPVGSQRSRLQSPAERMQRQLLCECTARPKVVCPPLRQRVRRSLRDRRHAAQLFP